MRVRRLAILSAVAAAVLATGCVHYGHGPRYDRGWYGGRYGGYYGRPVVVRPAPVIVRRPVVRYVVPKHRHPKREWAHAHGHHRHEKHWKPADRRDRRHGWHRRRGR